MNKKRNKRIICLLLLLNLFAFVKAQEFDTLVRQITGGFEAKKDESYLKFYIVYDKVFFFDLNMMGSCRVSIGSYKINDYLFYITDIQNGLCYINELSDNVVKIRDLYLVCGFDDLRIKKVGPDTILIERIKRRGDILFSNELHCLFSKYKVSTEAKVANYDAFPFEGDSLFFHLNVGIFTK